MIKGIVNNIPKDIKRVVMPVGGVDKGWEVRDQLGNLLWGAEHTLTGIDSINFKGYGTSLTAWSIYGNGQQTGTPMPDTPIIPTFCGKLVESNWTIPITCAGQTVPVYLGQVQTVRRIKKLVLTGEEKGWTYNSAIHNGNGFLNSIVFADYKQNSGVGYCTHYPLATASTAALGVFFGINLNIITAFAEEIDTIDKWKSYLSERYAAGTPVTVWYVLATPETAIVNEPLCKIGDYADELRGEDVGVTIPTTRGQNVLTVGTDLQPSSVTISGHIK